MSIFRSLLQAIPMMMASLFVMVSVIFSGSPAWAGTVSVEMGAGGMLSFTPAEVTIAPGDTVHFETGVIPGHNVKFDPANSPAGASDLDHAPMAMSGGFDVAFPADAATGTYSYYCEPHRSAGMVGKIVVQ